MLSSNFLCAFFFLIVVYSVTTISMFTLTCNAKLIQILMKGFRWSWMWTICLLINTFFPFQKTYSADFCLGTTNARSFELTENSATGCSNNPFPGLGVGKYAIYEQKKPGSVAFINANLTADVFRGSRDTPATITTVDWASVTSPNCHLGHSWLKGPQTTLTVADRDFLDKLAPAGEYTLEIQAGGRNSKQQFYMPDSPWPKTPFLMNYEDAQGIDASKDFVLRLAADTEGVLTRIDIVPFSANAGMFFYDAPCDSPSSDTWHIPAHSFAPSAQYMLLITSSRLLGSFDENGFPSLSLVCVCVSRVVIQTRSTTPSSPTITSQPRNVDCEVGASATFSISANGMEPMGYQWYKDGSPIAGAKSRNYTITKVGNADAGKYTATVTNPAGSLLSREALLRVWTAPAIVTQPRTQTRRVGESVTFKVNASGTAPLQYQWYKGGRPIPRATRPSYTLQRLTVENSGVFSVKVKNKVGTVSSKNAILTVQR